MPPRSFRALRASAPPELWILFILKCLESYAYFAMSLSLTLYLTEEFGIGDVRAGWVMGAWGLATTVFGLICGQLIDTIGVPRSLLIGAAIKCVVRAASA